ncbi:Yip1-domain-containing protein [Rhizopus microsporus var. microsporus]|uniref:Yip1-domain-containing protein n=1 Tax=Rhizopus microsporus var. microsporus TaxID=86635 RepID=A0A1X0RFG9_RHIZD|nr:Yip1-domain-containing protein [Rhizopus microsporus var. microsporus]
MTSKQPIHSVLFDNQNEYYAQPTSGDNLQFYSSSYGDQYSTNYYASPPAGDMRSTNYEFSNSGSFWSAFGTGGYADEPPLLEELGLNFEHIKTKSLTVLNPFRTVPSTIMDDTDLAGPLLFIFLFGTFLLLSRKAHFGYIYGVGVLGVLSIYLILNLMSENGIDGSRTASVLGYCLLPMVMLSGLSVFLKLDTIVVQGCFLNTQSIQYRKRTEQDSIDNHIKKKRPVDRNIPPKIEAYVPESRLYEELCQFERNMDTAIMRKRLEIQEALGKPNKVKRTMRIFISNTAADQLHQEEEEEEVDGQVFEINSENEPSWTLKIEGRLLDPLIPTKKAQPVQKFTSFFKSIIVELDPEKYPEGNLIEWRKQPSSVESDGIEVKRKGDTNVNVRIILVPDYTPQKFKLTPALSELTGLKLATKSHIVSELWNYIKLHNCQDAKDKRIIHCDRKMQAIFNATQLQFHEIPELIQRQVTQPDPIVLEYTIRVDKRFNMSSKAYDVDVELDSVLKQKMMNVVAASQVQKDILSLDDKIVQCVQSINNSKMKRDFLMQFSSHPIEFINKWIHSQARDIEAVLGETKVNLEDVRQTEFYKQPWVKEAVFHYLTSKTQQKMQELLATQSSSKQS